MRRLTALILALIGCTGGPPHHAVRYGTSENAIVNGSPDSTHTAVVAVLAGGGGGSYYACSGTIVQVKNGNGYVLTAAHCCNDPSATPSLVVLADDYGPYSQYIGSSNPPSPAHAVVAGSISADPLYNQSDHDFCMLQFAGATSSMPVIPVATPTTDRLAVGVNVEYVGFGATDGSGSNNNSQRYTGTAPVDQSVSALIIQYSEGANQVPGPCEGDSGGPALLPAGAAQNQQIVVATTSYGDQSCQQYGVSSRVSSETGPNGFITTYLGTVPTPPARCTSNSACSGSTPICDPGAGHCRACASGDCSTGACATASSDPNHGRCVQCIQSSQCPSSGVCNQTTDTCVQCQSNAQCSRLNPICNQGTCQKCQSDSDCSGNATGGACETQGANAGLCVPCSSGNTSACSGSTSLCDTTLDVCVECLTNADCLDSTLPACYSRTQACVCPVSSGCGADGGTTTGPRSATPARPCGCASGPGDYSMLLAVAGALLRRRGSRSSRA